jgi:hypothetical protein
VVEIENATREPIESGLVDHDAAIRLARCLPIDPDVQLQAVERISIECDSGRKCVPELAARVTVGCAHRINLLDWVDPIVDLPRVSRSSPKSPE